MARTTWRTVVGLALVGALATGCSGGDPPEEPEDYVPTPSATSSSDGPTAAPSTPATGMPEPGGPPALPEAATRDTRRGAEAFVRHYVDLLNYAYLQGSVGPMSDAAVGCVDCEKYEDLFRTTYADGGFFRGEGWQVQNATAYQTDPISVIVNIRIPPIRYKTSSGDELEQGRGSTTQLRFIVRRQDSGWRVIELKQTVDVNEL